VTSKERRQYLRLNSEGDIEFQVATGEKTTSGDKTSGECKNLSIEGLCLHTDTKLKSATRLDIEILLPQHTEPLHLKGEVRWCRPCKENKGRKYEIGVKLFTIRKNDETRFILFVCSLMRQDLVKYIISKDDDPA